MVATAVGPSVLRAQTVEGRLLDERIGIPIDGAIVVLLDGEGNRRAQTLTDQEGRFVIRARAAGRYVLGVERIGYRAWASEPFVLAAGETRTQDVSVTAIPVRLDPVLVEGEEDCEVRPREGAAAALLWEEARKALAVTSLAEQRRLFRFVINRYERRLDPNLQIRDETSRDRSMYTDRPFTTLPPSRLVTEGFVSRAEDGSRTYYAPDAHVLLSDDFLNTHCFRPRRGSERDGLVGLAFEPARDREVSDIEGVLWLDTATAELRTLEFRYANLDGPAARYGPGGYIEFRRIPSGAWIVQHWWIRMPLIVQQEQRRVGPINIDRQTVVQGYKQDGGEVTTVRTRDGKAVFDLSQGTVVGQVRDGVLGTPLEHALVRLVGTTHVATTDRYGRFQIGGVPEGQYLAQVEHPWFALFHGDTLTQAVSVKRGRMSSVRITSPSLETIRERLCLDRNADLGTAVLTGYVRDPDTQAAVAGATVTIIHYTSHALSAARVRGRPGLRVQVVQGAQRVETETDSRGLYRVCGLPEGAALFVTAVSERRTSERIRVEFLPDEVIVRDLRLTERRSETPP